VSVDHGWYFPLAPDKVQVDVFGLLALRFKAKEELRFAWE